MIQTPTIEGSATADGAMVDFDSEGRIVAGELLAAKIRSAKGAV
jgi:hypothetical protein